ncbi:conserved Plasmodium protein, unknown function [Plasmodium gallinaceum]|uniref:RRM domain-containing protein n=1 Tax=Plasmodium gallinaceum TaxID=5849 RepID=A0A1J1GYR5_PLAGA|nr:conserved Plasmodium protein, unknown function [Plasmodium gallinaceum]CRG97455.1 conserved Plasmodium protein, unknown function [Plasmodium gallinaceum]
MLGKRKTNESQQKKRKKWIEELDDDLEEIDLECLNDLKENEKANIEEGLKEEEKEVSNNNLDEEKSNENLNELNDCVMHNENNKKRKRYEWMSSDDEDISSEDEENTNDEYDEDKIEENTDETKEDKNSENKDSENSTKSELSEKDKEKLNYINDNEKSNNKGNLKKNYEESDNKNNSLEIIDNINKYSINQLDIKLEDIEHIITYVYFNNIHFNCVTEKLVEFLENYTNNKIIQVNSDKSTNYTVLYKYDEKNNDKVTINNFSHYGKLFVHVKNYQDVLSLLKLNETQFMGRVIKSIQAYKKKNRFFILQAPSHYKYFIQVVINEKNKNNVNYVWMR